MFVGWSLIRESIVSFSRPWLPTSSPYLSLSFCPRPATLIDTVQPRWFSLSPSFSLSLCLSLASLFYVYARTKPLPFSLYFHEVSLHSSPFLVFPTFHPHDTVVSRPTLFSSFLSFLVSYYSFFLFSHAHSIIYSFTHSLTPLPFYTYIYICICIMRKTIAVKEPQGGARNRVFRFTLKLARDRVESSCLHLRVKWISRLTIRNGVCKRIVSDPFALLHVIMSIRVVFVFPREIVDR